jgi:hypothetical protein
MKICNKCNSSKDEIKDFHPRLNYCKSCRAEQKRINRINNIEAIKAKDKEYRKKEHVKERIKKYHYVYDNTPVRTFKKYLSNAQRRNIEFSLTLEDFEFYWQNPCYYCNSPIKSIGLDRVDNSIGYIKTNIVPCCWICNNAKSNADNDRLIKIADGIKKFLSEKHHGM